MTVIIAIEHPETGEKAIAADGRVCSGNGIVSESYEKLAVVGSVVIGLAGSYKAMDLLKALAAEIDPAERHDATVRSVVAALRKALTEDGWKAEERDGKSLIWDVDGVGVDRHGIYDIGCALDCTPVEAGRPVIAGSGGGEAVGAASILMENPEWTPADVVRRAVEATFRFDTSCGGKVTSVAFPAAQGLRRAS